MAGYIGPAPVPQATQNREAFTATGGQTTFATSGYKPGYLDVYLNGVKLAAADYTATNGSDVVLASGAAASDILEIVAFQEFTVADQAFTGDITFTGASYDAVWDASDNALEFGDNAKATFGASADLQIYHSGSNSHITEAGTGNLIIRADDFRVQSNAGEEYIAADANGAVSLRYDNAAKLATASYGIDVTGTVNCTGRFLSDSVGAGGGAGSGYQFGGDGNTGMYQDAYDQIQFSTNGAERLRITSGGNVMVGGTVAGNAGTISLNVGNVGSTNGGLQLWGTTTGTHYIQFGDESGTAANHYRGYMAYAHNGDSLRFGTASTERMRIDSSGNLLVGKTTTALATTGSYIAANGLTALTTDSQRPLILNRKTNDGDLIEFYKDGTTVGSIGANTGDKIYIGTGASGVGFSGLGLLPFSPSSNAFTNNTLDLGANGLAWKNLYLSGGVYLGGTGAANKLDDYEEGTWTPTVNYGTVSSLSTWYTKVGNIVSVGGLIYEFSDRSTGDQVIINNLPFTAGSTLTAGSVFFRHCNITGNQLSCYTPSASTNLQFWSSSFAGGYSTLTHSQLNSADARIFFGITYQT